MFGKRKNLYGVSVHLNGRHPYLTSTELDYPSRDIEMTVPARDWNDAEKQAMIAASTLPDHWSLWVTSMARVRP